MSFLAIGRDEDRILLSEFDSDHEISFNAFIYISENVFEKRFEIKREPYAGTASALSEIERDFFLCDELFI